MVFNSEENIFKSKGLPLKQKAVELHVMLVKLININPCLSSFGVGVLRAWNPAYKWNGLESTKGRCKTWRPLFDMVMSKTCQETSSPTRIQFYSYVAFTKRFVLQTTSIVKHLLFLVRLNSTKDIFISFFIVYNKPDGIRKWIFLQNSTRTICKLASSLPLPVGFMESSPV